MGWQKIASLTFSLLVCGVAGGQTWTSYDCDTTPDLAVPAWVHETAQGSSTVSDGVLTITSPESSGKELWRLDNPGFVNSTGWTVELRMRVNPAGADWDEETEILRVRDSAWGVPLFLGETNVGPDGWQTKNQAVNGRTFDTGVLYDVKGWHTYRLTGQGTDFRFYRDGNPTPILTVTLGELRTENYIKLGDVNDSGTIQIEVDYIRWAVDGAFPPTEAVPGEEPLAANLDFDNISDPDGPAGPLNADVVLWEQWQLVSNPATYQYTKEPGFWRHTAFAQGLRIFDPNSPFDGGLRQTVSAVPGWWYTFSGWFSLYNQVDGSTGHAAQVGIDPTGGGTLDGVWWSGPVPVGEEVGFVWQEASVTVMAGGSEIILYVRGSFTPSGGHERSFFAEDCWLTAIPPSTGMDDTAWYLYP